MAGRILAGAVCWVGCVDGCYWYWPPFSVPSTESSVSSGAPNCSRDRVILTSPKFLDLKRLTDDDIFVAPESIVSTEACYWSRARKKVIVADACTSN
jgi:hypothetical protein